MKLHRVTDSDMGSVVDEEYDMAFFASGYEERCIHVPQQLRQSRIQHACVLGFQEIKDGPERSANDDYFAKNWSGARVTMSTNDDGPVYELLRAQLPLLGDHVHMLVDYSSMSRLWYASLLNWARFAPSMKELTIDLAYAVGNHQRELRPMVINDVLCIPGCEGGAGPIARSVAVFGLGFEGRAALCVLDRLEPDEVYAFLASPAAFGDYPKRAREENAELIKHADKAVELPLGSVERTYSALAELVAPHRTNAGITLIPMGPKPHVLAAVLLAMRFTEISCLRVSGRRVSPEHVGTTGDVVVTRVEFKAEEGAEG